MGGTFNPIHIGHLLLAEWAMDTEGLDEVWFIPTGFSYMKQHQYHVSAEERFHMTSLAIHDNDRMKCLDIEVKRDGYTYTYETLLELRRQYPDYHFYFIYGADCLFSIEKWKYPERILANCTMIAATRGDACTEEMSNKIAELKDKYQADIKLLPFMQLGVSSTEIRERIKNKRSIKYLVPYEVITYIEEKGFYRDENN